MTLLAIDTSTGPASLALVEADGAWRAQHTDSESNKQSQRLVADIDAMVRQALPDYQALSAIVVTCGPGGFTGIRIGLAAARGLALAANLPLITLTSLETFAWQALQNQPAGATAVAMVDAYRGQAYTQPFERTGVGLTPLAEAEAIDYPALDAYLTQWPEAILIGNPKHALPTLQAHTFPHAGHAGSYAAFLLQQNDAPALSASRPAEAFYIRPPDAKPQKPFLS